MQWLPMRKLLLLMMPALALFLLPVEAKSVAPADEDILSVDDSDNDDNGIYVNDVKVDIEESIVKVSGGEGLTLEVVSLTGLPIMTIKIEHAVQTVELDIPKGCYLIKVGKVVRKIAIR